MPNIRAGDYRRQVTLQSKTYTTDVNGVQVYTWTNVATVRAAIEPATGREFFEGQALHTEVTHIIRTRYRAELADPVAVAAMRVVYGTRYFNVHARIDVDEHHREIHLMCSEGLNEG